MSNTVFTNVMIFDGSGDNRFAGEVRVEGRMITDVGRDGHQVNHADATMIDGRGATLMPGMIESHAHLTWPSNVEHVMNTMRKLPIEQHTLVTAHNARITLDHGFTSAYSAGGLGEHIEPELRLMIDAGYLPGPRLRPSSLEKGAEGVLGVPAGHDPTHDRDIDGLREYIARMKRNGCDTIKFLMSSDEAFAPGGSQTLMYSEEEAQAIGQAAREQDIWLACHAQSAESIKRAVRAGFRIIYHCTQADEQALSMLEENKENIFVAPAAGLLYARCYEARDFGIGPEEATKLGARAGLDANRRLIPEMHRRGIRVLPGGDYGFPYNPVGRNARDLQIFVEMFGFTPREALMAATRHGAALVDWPVGEIRAERWADILLVDGDPTTDITVLQDKNKLLAIMKDGAFYKHPPAQ